MFGSTVVDVALGLVFVFFLLSVVTSHINDLIAGWLRWRARDLEQGVRQLLTDPLLADKVMSHPLVRGLSGKPGKAPEYIPSNVFALALFDAILPGGNHPSAGQAIRMQMMTLPAGSGREAIVSIIDAANGDMAAARAQVESWFNAAMDRVSATYRQQMQWLTLLVAALLTLIFGVDSLALANSLWQEPTLRAAVAASAVSSTITPSTAVGASLGNTPDRGDQVQAIASAISQLGLPIGWTTMPSTLDGWAEKMLGLALTVLAISLGAPFWYQLLQSLGSWRAAARSSPQKTSS